MIHIYKNLYQLLTPNERKKAWAICILMIGVSLVEVAGIASIMPFIAVLSNPEIVESNRYLAFVYNYLDFSSINSFMTFLGVFFIGVLLLGLAVQALGIWTQLRYTQMRSYYWSLELFTGYLRQPYEWYLGRHSAQLTTSVIGEVRQVVGNVFLPALQIIASLFTSLLIITLLVLTDPKLALVAGGLLASLFYAISALLKNRVKKIGETQLKNQRKRHQVAIETFDGIKDIMISRIHESRTNSFSEPSYNWARAAISAGLASQIPHLITQAFLFGGMLVILLYLISSYGGLNDAMPVIALFAFAVYRLLPNMQKIYSNVTSIRSSEATFNAVCQDIYATRNLPLLEKDVSHITPLGLKKNLVLSDISYSYPGAVSSALKDINIEIQENNIVGFVGFSGAGKTTLIDIILGLLRPSSGSISVDEKILDESNLSEWKRTIGYVPQQIFLVDDTISANIAFGVPEDKISQERIVTVAKIANLHEFITDSLPLGYETYVGDKGVRLSGGQRQRIGIARALYHDPDLLIFDEATSALDNITEKLVMSSIANLAKSKTIILIAHRLTTVMNCDRIYLLGNGEISAQGKYDELLEQSEKFRSLASGNETQ